MPSNTRKADKELSSLTQVGLRHKLAEVPQDFLRVRSALLPPQSLEH